MNTGLVPAAALLLVAAACAGRAPEPVRIVDATDTMLTCQQIAAEIDANTAQMIALSGEESKKVVQNVAAGVAGLFIWPLWFAMDFQDAAGKEGQALAARNAYLAEHYGRQCGGRPAADGHAVLASADALARPIAGTAMARFSADQMRAWCGEGWTTRLATDGQTEVNPCHAPQQFE